MNILILAAGHGEGAEYPIWLSEIDGRLLIEHQVEALGLVDDATFVYALRGSEMDTHHVDDIVRQMTPDASIVRIGRDTAGAACTALLAIGDVDPERELIVASATDYIDADYRTIIKAFRDRRADAGILCFDSLHPRYSFVRTDEEGLVLEAAEKRPISRQANAGFYWYAKAADFFESLQRMILKDAHVGGAFYISPSLNELVLQNKKIAVWKLEAEQYRPMKDQKQVDVLEQAMDARSRHAT